MSFYLTLLKMKFKGHTYNSTGLRSEPVYTFFSLLQQHNSNPAISFCPYFIILLTWPFSFSFLTLCSLSSLKKFLWPWTVERLQLQILYVIGSYQHVRVIPFILIPLIYFNPHVVIFNWSIFVSESFCFFFVCLLFPYITY
jgi:hypothetical protein